jgi:hypothetical protein
VLAAFRSNYLDFSVVPASKLALAKAAASDRTQKLTLLDHAEWHVAPKASPPDV